MSKHWLDSNQAFEEEFEVLCDTDPTESFKDASEKVKKRQNLVGLAFSGGGIRSATFNLGVLEGLKNLGLLEKIDYLSTVSGGGYIGAWFSANCVRNENKPASAAPVKWLDRAADWSDSIRHLRRYSNYLAPQVGLFSADTWSMGMVWLRNTLLVQITLILAIAVALIVPRLLLTVFVNWPYWPGEEYYRWITVVLLIFGVVGVAGNQLRVSRRDRPQGVYNRARGYWVLQADRWPAGLGIGAACWFAAWLIAAKFDFSPFGCKAVEYSLLPPLVGLLLLIGGFHLLPLGAKVFKAPDINYDQNWVQMVVVAPMMLAGLLIAAVMWGYVQPPGQQPTPFSCQSLATLDTFSALFVQAPRVWPFPLIVSFCSLVLLAYCTLRSAKKPYGMLALVLAPTASIVVLHALMCALVLVFQYWVTKGPEGVWSAFVWGPPAVLYAFSLAIVTLIGIVGRQSTEGSREWWSRLGAWLCIYGLVWMIVCVASVYGPLLWEKLFEWKYSISGAWVLSTLGGLLAGNSGSTGKPDAEPSKPSMAKEVVAKVAPFVFIAGLLVLVSTAVQAIIRLNSDGAEDMTYWYQLQNASLHSIGFMWILFAGCLAALTLFAFRVDINEFSLNAFYRSRLVRCYLGATRKPEQRTPQAFTNFDDGDDVVLSTLVDKTRKRQGPLHIVNCALNLGGSSDLTIHTRHSASFTLTPVHCGSAYLSRRRANEPAEELGFVHTNTYGKAENQPSLGQAISVSGAAASPNQGYHTSPVVAFLMTLFNVRLGWWFPKPEHEGNASATPWFSLRYLFMELFGMANDRSKFLAVSDGGHFENLAAYELVRRRCRVIIIGDAECDPELKFEGLGTLIRMCEVDFHAKITIDVASIAMGKSEWSNSRCAVGRIEYNGDDKTGGPSEGILIYLKASMIGHEDTAILQYKSAHETFPHENTGDQFYGEDQFESYRLLGEDIASKTFEPAMDKKDDMWAMAQKLDDVWSATLRQVPEFVQNASRLMDLWGELGKREDLDFLDPQLARHWPGNPRENFRSGFYVGSQMLQLMENTYLALKLEDTWKHPDNRGWQELFKTWAQAEAVRETWDLSRQNYGIRFRHFCERELKLPAAKA